MALKLSREEQNDAAGGLERRKLRLKDGKIAIASVSLRHFNPYKQLWAYLQFKADGKTVTKYIGKASSETRYEALICGWNLVRERNLVEEFGWSWVERPKN